MDEPKSQWELFLEEEENPKPKEKQCSRCKKYKPLGAFYASQGKRPGIHSACKDCVNGKKRKYRSREDRFWKFLLSHTTRGANGCSIWTGYLKKGLPVYTWDNRERSVRRLVYRLSVGELPDTALVFTTCRNKQCVNRLHLKLGTKVDYEVLRCNSAPAGDKNGARLHPDRLARGEKHGSHTKPASRACGERHGSRTRPDLQVRGEKHGMAKLTSADVQLIRQRAESGVTQRTLAEQFGVHPTTVSLIINRKKWAHVE